MDEPLTTGPLPADEGQGPERHDAGDGERLQGEPPAPERAASVGEPAGPDLRAGREAHRQVEPGLETGAPPTSPRPTPRRLPYPLETWWGALLLGGGGILAYLTVGHLLPGLIVMIASLSTPGQVPSTEELERALVPYLPHVVAWGALVSVVGVAFLRGFGLLAPPPEPEVRSSSRWRAVGWVLFAGLAVTVGQQSLLYLQQTQGVPPQEQQVILAAAAEGGLALALALALAAPIGEELAFRRFLFGTLRVGLGRPLAYLLSIAAFSLIHFNPSVLPIYVWMSFWFTFAYERSGSVWGAIAVHTLNNGVAAWALLEASK